MILLRFVEQDRGKLLMRQVRTLGQALEAGSTLGGVVWRNIPNALIDAERGF
jgi:hypothetical protein